jgi:hypothetical protein
MPLAGRPARLDDRAWFKLLAGAANSARQAYQAKIITELVKHLMAHENDF